MKRVLSVFMMALLLLLMVPQTVRAAEAVTLTVKADKSVANPGDTINYTVSVGAVENMGGLEFKVQIPDGLTIVEESVVIPEGVAETMDSEGNIVLPADRNEYKWAYSAQTGGYTSSAELVILLFSCTVNEDAAFEEKSVTLQLEVCFDNAANPKSMETNIVPAKVTVEKVKVPVTGITLDKTTLAMKDDETAVLTATIAPEDADNKNITWSSDNAAVATVADGTVTAVAPGTAKVTVTTEDGSKTASCTITVTCAHAMAETEAVAATCTKDGNLAYYTCGKCSVKFADEAGTQVAGDVVVKAAGHKMIDKWVTDTEAHWKACENCAEKLEKANHTLSWVVDKAATEDETGLKHEECACGYKQNEATEIPKLDHVHKDIKHYEAVEATCMKEGSKEYWTCSSDKCAGKYYGDAECQTELTDIVIPKSTENHVSDGTWEMDAEKHARTCACGAKVDEGTHAYDNDADVYCNACNYKRYYIITGGADSGFVLGEANGLTFTVDGDRSLFRALEVDGAVLAEENYTVAEDSMTIVLTSTYLENLALGNHSLKVLYSDGKVATTNFRVEEYVEPEDDDDTGTSADSNVQGDAGRKAPKTGDDSNPMLWLVLLGLTVAISCGVIYMEKMNAGTGERE